MRRFYQTPPLKAGIYIEDMARLWRVRGGGWLKGKSIFQTQQGWQIQELTETVTTHRGPTQVQTRQSPSTKKGRQTQSLTSKLVTIATCWERDNQLSPVECHGACQPHPRATWLLRSNWSRQNGLLRFLSVVGLFVLLFCLWDFCFNLFCFDFFAYFWER